jgi:hypothetical protein
MDRARSQRERRFAKATKFLAVYEFAEAVLSSIGKDIADLQERKSRLVSKLDPLKDHWNHAKHRWTRTVSRILRRIRSWR